MVPVGSEIMPGSAGIYIGAYPITMARPDEAAEFYRTLSASPAIGGLEIPWTSSMTAEDLLGLRAVIPTRWRLILTMIPGTMAKLGADPSYGLASNDADAAQRAVADVADARAVVEDFHHAVGSQIVTCIEVHSAPRQLAGSSPAALARCLPRSVEVKRAVLTSSSSTSTLPSRVGNRPKASSRSLTSSK